VMARREVESISGADSMSNDSGCREPGAQKTSAGSDLSALSLGQTAAGGAANSKQRRRVQALMPSVEMKDEFDQTAAGLGMTESRFVVHLFMLYKRGQLKDESRRVA
jgi:hypothetical protein